MTTPSMRVACPVCDGTKLRYERTVAGYCLERCLACRHVVMNPQPSLDDLSEQYAHRDTDALVRLYGAISALPSVKAQWQGRLDWLSTLQQKPGRILDCGCGYGGFVEEAQRLGWDAHGIELGEWAAEAAAARNVKNIHIGPIAGAPFAPGSFDVIHASQVLEHLPQPRHELRHLRTLLAPQGLMWIDVPNYDSLTIRLNRDDFMLNEPPQHLNYFNATTLASLLTRCGFKPLQITTFGGLKWENLVGRPIRSEIADAYARLPEPKSKADVPDVLRSVPLWKRAALKLVVKPVLYDRLHLGMVLGVLARGAVGLRTPGEGR